MDESNIGVFGTSKIELALKFARRLAMDEADLLALQQLFWRIWAHPDLIGIEEVVTSLREIGGLVQNMWNEQLDAFGIKRWSSLSGWLEQHLPSIVSEIGIDPRTKQVAAGINPVLWQGVGLHPIYAMLWPPHAIEKHR